MADRRKYFYPPRPGNGAGTFSDDIVGLQTVRGGGLTGGNFEFTTTITEKVNRTFNVGAFSAPINLEDLDVQSLAESRRIQASQFRVYPNYDVSQVLNFSLYGSLAKRLSVSVTKIINFFPAALDIRVLSSDFTTGATAYNISYDLVNDETYFEIDVNRIHNPFGIEYSVSATTNLELREITTSKYRNLNDTFLDYCISINDIDYKVLSFSPSESLYTGNIAFYVSGAPFGETATTVYDNFLVRPNDYIVDKTFAENFDEVEQFLVNRLTQPEYTAFFQIPEQNQSGQFFINYQQATWPKDGIYNLDIISKSFEKYLTQLNDIAFSLDEFKTNLISRFLVSGSLKDFDTLGRKVEKVFQLYGRSFDDTKKFIDALAFMNSVHYVPENDIPSQLLVNLAQTLGWSSNFSPITNEDFLSSVFGNKSTTDYPGYARALTPTELNYQFYRNLILNSAYLFKSKGTRRSIEFLLRLIGAPEALTEFNEYLYIADQRVDMEKFYTQFAKITGGTYVEETPSYLEDVTFKVKGITFTAFTASSTYEDVSVNRLNYPVDEFGFPKAPIETEEMFFEKGAGWYESTPSHRSPDEVKITNEVYTGQNLDIQTQLQPFTYGQKYFDVFRKFPYMNEGFKLRKVIDNKKSWLESDNKIRIADTANYEAYYFIDDEKFVLNAKNIDLNLNPSQGLAYDVWDSSVKYDYPIPQSGLTIGYLSGNEVDFTIIKPDPKSKTFFEFYQTFWENMINVRNRMYITDGKTGGYPTLSSIFWKYLESEQTVGIPNNKYTYQKLIDYVNGIGPYWMKLIDQMIPATTIWNSGTKFENSIFHKQKFVYRRQRGCQFVPVPAEPCFIIGSIFDYTCQTEYVDFYIYPWLNGDVDVTTFSSILNNRLNKFLTDNNINIIDCNLNSLKSTWFVDMRIGNDILIQKEFYTGFGQTDVPTNLDWRNALIFDLPDINLYGLTYYLNGDMLTITNTRKETLFLNERLTLNVGIIIDINCVTE